MLTANFILQHSCTGSTFQKKSTKMINKFIRSLLAFLVLLSIVLVSCKSDEEERPIAPAGKIIAKIDGTAFEADGEARLSRAGMYVGGTVGNEMLYVLVTNAPTPGTYDVNGAAGLPYLPDAAVGYSHDGGNSFSSIF